MQDRQLIWLPAVAALKATGSLPQSLCQNNRSAGKSCLGPEMVLWMVHGTVITGLGSAAK